VLSERFEVVGFFRGESVSLEVRLEQTNDAPVWWRLSLWDLESRLGPQRHCLYETIFNIGSGVERKLCEQQDLFEGQRTYTLTPAGLEHIYRRAVAVGAMRPRAVVVPEVKPPGRRSRLSPLAGRRTARSATGTARTALLSI
jgi:hypothetical protein